MHLPQENSFSRNSDVDGNVVLYLPKQIRFFGGSMKRVLPYLLIITCIPIQVFAQWTNAAQNLLGSIAQANGAMTFKAGVVWAGSSSLWSSIDSGKKWVKNSLSIQGAVMNIFFLDRMNGLVTSRYGFIYRTKDGGNTWDQVESLGSATSAVFLDSPDHILVSEFQPGDVFYSNDAGVTWQGVGNNNWIREILPSINGKAYLLSGDWGPGEQIWKTADYGASWNEQPGQVNGDSWSFEVQGCNNSNMIIVNEGYSVTAAYDGRSRIYVSSDEGQTWSAAMDNASKFFAGSVCLGPNTAFVPTVSEANAGIWRSTDHGKTWKNIGGPSASGDTRLIAAIDDNHVIASDINGSIWITQNSGGDYLTLVNYDGATAISLSTINQQFNASSCEPVDSTIKLGIIGCSPVNGILDSAWIVGSSNIKISTAGASPRTLTINDSIAVQYSPTANAKDTAQLHLRYDLGSGVKDTIITIIGSSNSALISTPVRLHREVGVSYFGNLDTLPLGVDVNSSVNLDSIWPFLHDISGTFSFDSSVVNFAAFFPPSGWTLTSIMNRGNAVDFGIHNISSKSPRTPMDLGTAQFLPVYDKLQTSDVRLTSIVLDIGKQSIAPCVTDDEDQHWSVKVLVADGVNSIGDASRTNSLSIYPNPAGDELFVQNSNPEVVSISLYDAIGREVLSSNVSAASTQTLEMQSLPSGSYVLVGHVGDGVIIRRISKIR